MKSKVKIFNDPVHGFISISDDLCFQIIEHPYFQRLRRIKQLGLTHLIYPGALHTRFQHAIGAMYLMEQAVQVLKSKGLHVSDEEYLALKCAILLHDIGHGPYSHALENSIVDNINHEKMSEFFFDKLNEVFKGELSLAKSIFNGSYHRAFLRQLVSSQLDVDRLDFLKRDSYFTGVSEGVISTDRIIKMLNTCNDELAVESKGIYSVEKFIVARRLMYWQVYLHKTVISAEHLIVQIIRRARELTVNGTDLFATPTLKKFLLNNFNTRHFQNDDSLLDDFSMLDDYDVFTSIKAWCNHDDRILSVLCRKMVNRNLFAIEISKEPFSKDYIDELRIFSVKYFGIDNKYADYFVSTGEISNHVYNPEVDRINILYRDGKVYDITESSDQLNITVLSKTVKKYFLCYPKECLNKK